MILPYQSYCESSEETPFLENSYGLCGKAVCRIHAREKFSAIREVIRGCSVFGDLLHCEAFESAVVQRELKESTGIGHGVAIAHGKSLSVESVKVGLGISVEGVDFSSIDGDPVHLLFVIASSPLKQAEYVKSLAAIMTYLKNTTIRSALRYSIYSGNETAERACTSFLDMMAAQNFR